MNMTTSNDRIKTGWVLASISVMLTASILFWYVGNPQVFIETRVGFHSEVFSGFYVWLFTLFIVLAYITYTVVAIPFVRSHLFTFSWLKVIGIWAAVVSGIVEEIIFRHFIMDYFMSMGVSNVWQILISGIAFGMAHVVWVFLKGEYKMAIPVVISTTILGMLLAVLYIMADRSTFAPIMAHVLINIAIEPWLMLAAVSGKVFK